MITVVLRRGGRVRLLHLPACWDVFAFDGAVYTARWWKGRKLAVRRRLGARPRQTRQGLRQAPLDSPRTTGLGGE
jgi:hypothetical protein